MLGDETTKLQLGSISVALRPSLRAAVRFERHVGLDVLAQRVAEGSLTFISALIDETTIVPIIAPDHLLKQGILQELPSIREALIRHVLALAGIDPDAAPEPKADEPAGERVDLGDHFAKLYRLATGGLGWTPEEAWKATPREIMEAYRGRVDLLNAIFGGKTEEPLDGRTAMLQAEHEFDSEGLRALAALGRVR